MDLNMKDSYKETLDMEKESTIIPTKTFMLEIGEMIFFMEMDAIYFPLERDSKDN